MDFFIANASDRQRAHIAIDKHELPCRVKLSKGGKRSLEQNAYLWGVCYEMMLAHSLRDLGFDADDVHEYMLGEYHGWKTLKGLGVTRKKPIERSSGKSVSEFMSYIDFVQRKASDMGVYIPDSDGN